LTVRNRHDPNRRRESISVFQIRITKQRRTASAGRSGQEEPQFPLDPRDPDIVRAKKLQRRPRRPSDPRRGI
jgi:hypothetical protein